MRIAVLICSCHAYPLRRQGERETWIRRLSADMPYFFYVGRGTTQELDVVCLEAPDGYNDLPPKTHAALQYAVQHLTFDWLIRLDDDTFLAPERLPGLILEMAQRGAEYIGSDRCREPQYATGGAGVILSRRLVEHLVTIPRPPSCPESPDQDDGWIGWKVRQAGGKLFWTPRLHHDQAFWPDPCNDIVTGHYVTPAKMRQIYQKLYG